MAKIIKEGLTFDDVLLIPQKSHVVPSQVSLTTKLSPRITLNIPIVSAAMDTVTESELAIVLAREGGLGFIHKNMSIEKQVEEVMKVKRCENGMISNPITLGINADLQMARDLMAKYKISGLPVVDNEMKLLGIITNRDLKYRQDLSTKVGTVMTHERLITAPLGISFEDAKQLLLQHRIEKLPIVENGYLKGLITIKDIDNQIDFPHSCKDAEGRLRVGAAVGVGADTLERVRRLVDADVDIITIDSAHGHSKGIIEMVKAIRQEFPQLEIVAGNIVTAAAAQELYEAGANTIKVGIGPGSICTTRIIAGVGMPQLSAIMEVVEYCRERKIPVIADGGIKNSGDIVKALAAGASCVMLGSLLAATHESPGEEILYNGRTYKSYVGMGSLVAMKRGSKDRYFQNEANISKLVPEGIESMVPIKGKLKDVVFQLTGGIRSGMGYCGAPTIDELYTNGQFVKITPSGLRESHPHNVVITKEAPNYSSDIG